VISIIVLICGCNSSSKTESDKDSIIFITIDKINNKTTYPLSTIAEKIDVIELDTNDLSLINGEIRGVHLLGNNVIIQDASSRTGVLVFDLKGKFCGTIGKLGQGPGELSGLGYNRQAVNEKGFIFWFQHRFVIYDIYGNLIEDRNIDIKTKGDGSSSVVNFWDHIKYSYYFNDSLFFIRDVLEEIDDKTKQMTYFKIYDYSTGNCLDSLFISVFEPDDGRRGVFIHHTFNTVIHHKGQVYMFYAAYQDEYSYIYVIENNQIVPFARFELNSFVRGLTVTNRYIATIHGEVIRNIPLPNVITPEVSRSIRNTPNSTVQNFSYFVYDRRTGKSINSYHGFVDDIHHSDEIVHIKFIDGGEKFYYTQEGKWSEELKMELNPTLYIGTFKK
jgi:hypothetical protein